MSRSPARLRTIGCRVRRGCAPSVPDPARGLREEVMTAPQHICSARARQSGRARGAWLAHVLVVSACASACAGRAAAPAPPVPIPTPEHEGDGQAIEVQGAAAERVVLPEPERPRRDEILRSGVTKDPEFQREVARWVEFWRTRSGRSFPEYLARMSWFDAAVDSTLERKGLPPTLRYLPLIESGYSPGAVSRARAVGLWQFMAPTAKGFGMGVSPLLDERRDPFKSTEAATDFLQQLRAQFGSWFLALAAYNSGPYRIQRLLDTHAPLVPPSDSLFWALRRHLPRETQDYIPKLFAAALVAQDPEAHGFAVPRDTLAFAIDEVVVPDATTLDVVAEAAGVPLEDIERLNPEILRGMTPPGRETALRVPAGKGGQFRERYALIPPEERVSYVEHAVEKGETLSHIARKYGVPLSDLQAANPRVRPKSLRIGQTLTVPIAPKARAAGGTGTR
ncbi:MAG: LysM peptidoglycan-binding domain-containing protein [Gemmatimonadetes bacterium]|nr:LysM peptidoglycan-binding domain-containing protein [Gemmatimonadota bacterium]